MRDGLLKKIYEIMLLAGIFILPLVFSRVMADPFWVVERFFLRFAVPLALFVFLVSALTRGRAELPRSRYSTAFLVFITANIAGVFAASNHFYLAGTLGVNLCYIALFYLVLVYCREGGNNPVKIKTAVIASAVIMAVYGMFQAAGIDFVPWQTTFSGRAASTLGNPNFLAGHMVLVFPVAFGLFLGAKGRGPRAVLFLSAALMASALVLTQTRGAYLAFAVSAIILAVFAAKRGAFAVKANRRIVAAGAVLFAVFASFYFASSPAAVDRITSTFKGDDAAPIRITLWKNTMNMIKDRPLLGTGAGNFHITYSYYQSSAMKPSAYAESDYYKSGHAHNDFLHALAEYGILLSLIHI